MCKGMPDDISWTARTFALNISCPHSPRDDHKSLHPVEKVLLQAQWLRWLKADPAETRNDTTVHSSVVHEA
jgi:hypothetical protein